MKPIAASRILSPMTRRIGVARRLIGVGIGAGHALPCRLCLHRGLADAAPAAGEKGRRPAPRSRRPRPGRRRDRPSDADRGPLVTSGPIEPLEPVQAGRDAAAAAEPGVHMVQSGETLYSIARRYDVDAFAFAEHNDLPAPFAIYAGQRLSIPPAGSSPPSTPAGPGADEKGPMVASLPATAQPLPSPPANERARLRLAGGGQGRFDLRAQGPRPAQRRHQHRDLARRAGAGGRERRRRLCRQRAPRLRQHDPDQASGRLDQHLRAQRQAARQPRRPGPPRAGDRQGREAPAEPTGFSSTSSCARGRRRSIPYTICPGRKAEPRASPAATEARL